MNGLNTDWIKETIPKMEYCNWLYNFICFCLGKSKRKMTYEEMYVFFYGLYRKKHGEENAKEMALAQILNTYKYLHNNNLPNGIKYDD